MAPSPSRKCAMLLGMLRVCTGDLVEIGLRDGTRLYGRVEDVSPEAILIREYSYGSVYGTHGGEYLVIPGNVAYVRRIDAQQPQG